MSQFRKLLFASIFFIFGACGLTTQRPKLEMTLAAEAFIAAKSANAQIKAPTPYRKAEYYYLKASSSYRRKYFNQAKQYAELSQKFSEEAEYIAIKKVTMDSM